MPASSMPILCVMPHTLAPPCEQALGPSIPAFLTRMDLHCGVASSEALRRAGIDAATPDPPGGSIDRAPDGTPTGILR